LLGGVDTSDLFGSTFGDINGLLKGDLAGLGDLLGGDFDLSKLTDLSSLTDKLGIKDIECQINQLGNLGGIGDLLK